MILFKGSLSDPGVIHSYISSDPLGQIQRDRRSGYSFAFNLTSSNTSVLVSTMTVTVDANSSLMISTATVTCGEGSSEWAVLRIFDGNTINDICLIQHLCQLNDLCRSSNFTSELDGKYSR